MLQRTARPYFLAVAACILLLIPVWHVRNNTTLVQPFSGSAGASDETQLAPVVDAARPPKVTIIGIWMTRGASEPTYMNYFFQSIEANPRVNFLFINVIDTGTICKRHSHAPNIKEICLSHEDYYELHVDFLCQRWNCDQLDRTYLSEYLEEYMKTDRNHSFFRILRSGIFERYLDPSTTIWGWCDMDEFWGNFERNFPWDVAHDYDIIAITSQPDYRPQRLLFTRGHMAFFRHSPEVLQKLHSYSKFSSLAAFLLLPETRVDAEESEFSQFYFGVDESFTFLHLEGMIDSYGTNVISPFGTYYFQLALDEITPEFRRAIIQTIQSRQTISAQPTFSPNGTEQVARVLKGESQDPLWFPTELAVLVEPGWDSTERTHEGIFMRREPGGPVLQWLEPTERYVEVIDGIQLNEALYKHWQGEKHTSWFNRLSREGLEPGQTFVQFHGDEGQIWDADGNVVFETGRD